MKKSSLKVSTFSISLFIITLLIIAGCSHPKKTTGINDDSAPMEASIIEVQTDLAPKKAYRKTSQILQEKGYTLANTDATLFTISTKPKTADDVFGPVRDMVVNANVRQGDTTKVVFTGEFFDGVEIRKKGTKGSPVRKAWKRLHNIATEFGDDLNYR